MRLVDDEAIDGQPAEVVEEAGGAESLRCEVEEAKLAARRRLAAIRARVAAVTWLCTQAAGTPSALRRATWSTISAISGDTTMVRPPPAIPGTQYAMLFPEPVGATKSTSARASDAATTSACPGRNSANPKVCSRTARARGEGSSGISSLTSPA